MDASPKEPLDYAIDRELCSQSFYEFTLEAFKIIDPGTRLVDNWHIKYLCDVLQSEVERINAGRPKTKDLIINIPPRSLKSIIATICLPAWAWTRNPQLKFIGSSYSSDLSIEHNVMCRRIVESEWYQTCWPEVRISSDQNTKGKFENTALGFRKATSTGGTITGQGADVIIVDDPVNPKEASSDVQRKAANTHFDLTLTTRLNQPEKGLFIVVMQRLHENDLTGHLLAKQPEGWNHICIPAEISENVSPPELKRYYTEDGLFFPARFTRAYLDRLKVALGSYGYAGQILQRPAPDEGGLIKKAWFQRFQMTALPSSVKWDFVMDTAYTEKQSNDPTGILSYTIHEGNFYIRNWNKVWMEFPQLLKFLPSHVCAHGYTPKSIIHVEPKASGKSLVQTLRQANKFQQEPVLHLNIKEDENPTKDKIARAMDVSPTVEAGRVYLLEGASWVEDFLNEVGQFPNASHDEAVDCLVMMINKAINKKFSLVGIA